MGEFSFFQFFHEGAGKGIIFSALSGRASAETNDEFALCLSCKKCLQNCPLAIDTPSMVNKLRLASRERILEPHLMTAYDFIDAHVRWAGSAMRFEVLSLISKLLQSSDD